MFVVTSLRPLFGRLFTSCITFKCCWSLLCLSCSFLSTFSKVISSASRPWTRISGWEIDDQFKCEKELHPVISTYETMKGLGVQSSFTLHRFVFIISNVLSWNTLPWAWNDWLHPSIHVRPYRCWRYVSRCKHACCPEAENHWKSLSSRWGNTLTVRHLDSKTLALSPVFAWGSTDV